MPRKQSPRPHAKTNKARKNATPLTTRVKAALEANKPPRLSDVYALCALVEQHAKRNEFTSKRVASIAGRVQQALAGRKESTSIFVYESHSMTTKDGRFSYRTYDDLGITVADVQALAASALTQAPTRSAR